jgi:hypothetical protein
MGRREHETQDMINIAHAFPTMEGYKLQPAKSVIINIQPTFTVMLSANVFVLIIPKLTLA